MRTGVWVRACFTSLNDFLALFVHLTPNSFLIILVMFLNSSARLGMNLLKKFIFPIKDWNSLRFLWRMIGIGWSMRSYIIGTGSSWLRDLSLTRRYSRHHMILHWQDIRGLPKPTRPLERGSHGRCWGSHFLARLARPKDETASEPLWGPRI